MCIRDRDSAFDDADETLPRATNNTDADVEEETIFPDIVRIPHHCSGEHVRAMIMHQLQQVGRSTWDAED
eukprot:9306611-Alexandrium_andersonii.AAC.1